MEYRGLDFHADGLKPNRTAELMGLMNAERARGFAAVEESGAGDHPDIFATVGVRHIRAISWKARNARWGGLKDLAHSCGVGAVVAWFAAGCALALFIVATSGLHLGWKVFASLPLLAGAAIAAMFFVLGFRDTVSDAFSIVSPLVTGRYPEETVSEMVYRAGSVWALGSSAIHIHAGRPYQRDWKPETRSIPYTSIQSIEIRRQNGQISFMAEGDWFALFEIECRLRAEDIAAEIIARARGMGHEIHRMSVRSKSMDGLGREVPADLLERLSRSLPGVKVVAVSIGLESMIEIHMERADQVPMGQRVADFEGFPVAYIVPRSHAD